MITFLLGGARSGKSRRALQSVEPAKTRYFVATAEPVDDEFVERIAKHQKERDASWQTVESPIALVDTLSNLDAPDTVIVVDCLTLWLGNLLHHEQDATNETQRLIALLSRAQADIRLVSNEVGLGLVPENALGREFRDLQGQLNQRIASIADRVELMVAGLPLLIKPQHTN